MSPEGSHPLAFHRVWISGALQRVCSHQGTPKASSLSRGIAGARGCSWPQGIELNSFYSTQQGFIPLLRDDACLPCLEIPTVGWKHLSQEGSPTEPEPPTPKKNKLGFSGEPVSGMLGPWGCLCTGRWVSPSKGVAVTDGGDTPPHPSSAEPSPPKRSLR